MSSISLCVDAYRGDGYTSKGLVVVDDDGRCDGDTTRVPNRIKTN